NGGAAHRRRRCRCPLRHRSGTNPRFPADDGQRVRGAAGPHGHRYAYWHDLWHDFRGGAGGCERDVVWADPEVGGAASAARTTRVASASGGQPSSTPPVRSADPTGPTGAAPAPGGRRTETTTDGPDQYPIDPAAPNRTSATDRSAAASG